MFADPLLAGELPGDQELIEIAEAAPNAATAMLKLYRAYRERPGAAVRPVGSAGARGPCDSDSPARGCPIDEVRDDLREPPQPFSPRIEEEAESFTGCLTPGDDLLGALKAWLRADHGIVVKVLPVATMPQLAPPL